MTPDQLQLFNPEEEKNIIDRRLPHWQQAGAICFINWRTHDSMPEAIVKAWEMERIEWLILHGISPEQAHHSQSQNLLSPDLRLKFHHVFQNRWMDRLDECHG